METPETLPTNSAQAEIPCRFLRSKEMYYDAPDDDAFASGIFWCQRTQEGFGPDGEPCDKKRCCANRTCYVT